MKNTRRTFLQSLSSIPLLGWAFASAKPATPPLQPVKVNMSVPVYGFDERLVLSDIPANKGMVFYAGEDLDCGLFVAFDCEGKVVRANITGRPIGITVSPLKKGNEVQDKILVQGAARVQL